MTRRPRTIREYGTSALLLEWEARIDPDINQSVHWYGQAIAGHGGVVECVPAYASLLVRYLPPKITAYQLREVIFSLPPTPEQALPGVLHNLPVCYHPDVAPDLGYVTKTLGVSAEQLVALHLHPIYLVYQLGFLAGFGFLGKTEAALEIARRADPRRSVPRGSVGLAGRQTGIYPSESPGGWQLIGRCPLDLLRTGADPMRLRAGDRVKFYPIDLDTFHLMRTQPLEAWPTR